jgi:preprotein translocase subunit YajC
MNILSLVSLSLIGISNAYADTAAGAGGAASGAAPTTSQGLLSFLPMLLILVFFMYFMVIRPQSKRAKDHRNLIGGLKVGDEVVTLGGIFGKIEKIGDDAITLNIAENVSIMIQKSSVAHSVPKGTIKSASANK